MAKRHSITTLEAHEIGLLRRTKGRVGIRFAQKSRPTVHLFVPETSFSALLSIVVCAARAAANPSLLQTGPDGKLTIGMAPIDSVSLQLYPRDEASAVITFTAGKADLSFIASKEMLRGVLSRLPILGRKLSRDYEISVSPEGIWQLGDEDEEFAAKTLPGNSDRAVALIAATMIENRLQQAILAHSIHNAKIRESMFGVGQPLSGFNPKIDLAYMMGIITKVAHSDLKKINRVRIKFAHYLSTRDFSTEEVANEISSLQLIETHVGNSTGENGETIMTFDSKILPRIRVSNYEERKTQPRQRFIITTQLFTFAAAIADRRGTSVPFI